jgi:hypothetical protein
MDASAFDLTAAWFAIASDEGPLSGDPLSTERWAELAPIVIGAFVWAN